jgi:hypothetical protein
MFSARGVEELLRAFPTACPIIACWMLGARSSVVGWGAMLQAGRLRVRAPMRSLSFLQFTLTSSRSMALELTRALNRNEYQQIFLVWGEGQSAFGA